MRTQVGFAGGNSWDKSEFMMISEVMGGVKLWGMSLREKKFYTSYHNCLEIMSFKNLKRKQTRFNYALVMKIEFDRTHQLNPPTGQTSTMAGNGWNFYVFKSIE